MFVTYRSRDMEKSKVTPRYMACVVAIYEICRPLHNQEELGGLLTSFE